MRKTIHVKGTVVRDPELKTTARGKAFTRVTVAATEVKRDGLNLDAAANKWQTAVFWGDSAEDIAGNVRRGMEVFVAGDHVVRKYDEASGKPKTTSEIHGPVLEVLDHSGAQPVECKIEACGIVVRDPELRTTGSGKAVANVTIAADEVTKDGIEVDARANKWQTAVFWGDQAKEQARSIKKGMRVRMTGDLVRREYENTNGETKPVTEIHRAKVEVVEGNKGSARQDPEAA